jgi:hypothetical protein
MVAGGYRHPPAHPNCRCTTVLVRAARKAARSDDGQCKWRTIRRRPVCIREDHEHAAPAGAPPSQPWRDPPSPTGRAGQRRAGGYAANGETNTRIGDLGEASLIRQAGMRSLLPPGKRQGPFDMEYDRTSWAFEVKTVTTGSTEYKIKVQAHEKRGKIRHARQNGLTPGSLILVMDVTRGRGHAYRREGIGNYRLVPGGYAQGWHYLGEVA